MVATCEHVDSPSFSTHLQLIGGAAKPGELSRYGLSNPRLMEPEESRAGLCHP
jgi:hypothetical protein